ncbi:putative nuclease HARBI1 [Uranotaenia lowii]|uniref:putative nuclease HARBI1 n=1 Tax=Uranotaenia lowii TaxID=190385 RepID=UPI00247A0931|nr:putative nuclease HARBI1 [Uranotaenia lowii]XP_055606714.1 putative nuclease HARBI1 [Uranotaenia lowii]
MNRMIFFPLPLTADFEDLDYRESKVYHPRRTGHDKNFKSLYRFSRRNVNFLANTFLNEYNEKRGGALDNIHKMKCLLRYLGDPGFQVGVGEDLGIHQSTVCKTIWSVAKKVASKASDWIKFPQNYEDFEQEKKIWHQKYKFPSAIGAIDCTHVAIKRPHIFHEEYVNRKGVTTFNVQATCNGAELFTSVDCRWVGSVHDARIWRNSGIRNLVAENLSGAILLGDEAYPLTPWLMTPFKKAETVRQKAYNKLHSQERVIIERLFGQVKQRFPILQSKIRLSTDKIPTVIIACFVLHNVAKFLNDDDFAEDLDNIPDILTNTGQDTENLNIIERGKRRRDVISSYLS